MNCCCMTQDLQILYFNPDVPGAVQNLKPVRTTAKLIAVGWEEPADNGGEKIVEYVVDRQTVGSKDWQRVS